MNSETVKMDGISSEFKRAWSGELPPRYAMWRKDFINLATARATPDCSILDVGAGRSPILPVDMRPPGSRYTGLDVSLSEIEEAPRGSYDDFVVGDICTDMPALRDKFDLVISWQLLEHVKSLDDALENIRTYVRPGGHFLAQLSGAFSFFALTGRVLPHGAARAVVRVVQRRDPARVFPAYYNHCWSTAIRRVTSNWSSAEVIPQWYGGAYLTRARPLLAINSAYEHWAITRGHSNLATHYIIDAQR
jgi:SAM-dependent methyltransferase